MAYHLFALYVPQRPKPWCWLFILALCCSSPGFGQQTVYYPRAESLNDERVSYPIALLKLCLAKSGESLELKPSPAHMQQGRSLRLLEQGKIIDVVWTVTSKAREETLLPIRIPIDRGLIGWRLLLISQKNEAIFGAINSLSDLAVLRAGQGHDWPDANVLRENQFSVVTSSTYEGLFDMLERDHIHYFPRSVAEIWPEQKKRTSMGLVVEPRFALHYPEALYFFVNRNNIKLAGIIERGLLAAIADGSMLALFNQFYSAQIAQADLTHRKIFTLSNGMLPAATPLSNAQLWFDPIGHH